VAAMQFDRSRAVRAAKLCVRVDQGFGDGLQLPERFITTADLEPSAFDLTLINFFGFGCHVELLYCCVRFWCVEKVRKLLDGMGGGLGFATVGGLLE